MRHGHSILQSAGFSAAFVLSTLWAVPVAAAPTAAQSCEAAFETAAGKYGQCILAAEARDAKIPDPVKLSASLAKCAEKLSIAADRALAKYGASNCSAAAATDLGAFLDACLAPVSASASPGGLLPTCGDGAANAVGEQCDGADLDGESCASLGFASGALACDDSCRFDASACVTPSACGNGAVDAPEQCDGTSLGGATCTSLGYASGALGCTAGCAWDTAGCVAFTSNQRFPATGQDACWDSGGTPIDCGSAGAVGQDGRVRAGAVMAFRDEGDGTITDLNTGLTWEKLDASGGAHDATTTWSWPDALAVKIPALNAGSGFAGHTDWRLPNRTELMSIVSFRAVDPFECLDLPVEPAFQSACTPGCTNCSCTVASCFDDGRYWTSTSHYYAPGNFDEAEAWFVDFLDGGYNNYDGKTTRHPVRAVRGGP